MVTCELSRVWCWLRSEGKGRKKIDTRRSGTCPGKSQVRGTGMLRNVLLPPATGTDAGSSTESAGPLGLGGGEILTSHDVRMGESCC